MHEFIKGVLVAGTAAATLLGCGGTTTGTTAAKPVCDDTIGYMVDGTLQVTLDNGAGVPCDLVYGQRLDLVWNAHTEGAGWGSDASVARAEQEALDLGCDPHWYNDGDYRLVGENCDW